MDADTVTKLIAYEQDGLTEAEAVTLFQRLIDTGAVWRLQGRYGRRAQRLIEAGLCKATREPDTCATCGGTLEAADYGDERHRPVDCVACRSIF